MAEKKNAPRPEAGGATSSVTSETRDQANDQAHYTTDLAACNSVAEAARAYLERGWRVIPIPFKKKAPKAANWQHLNIRPDQVNQHFPDADMNVGVLLGEASGGLIDVDLDHLLTVQLADHFLPPTDSEFGRESKPRSHRLYKAPNCPTTKFQHGDDGMFVEVRADKCQTVFPPSVHPSGESIRWEWTGDPKTVDASDLMEAVGRLAAAALIASKWPQGSRDECAMALAGALLRGRWGVDEASNFIRAVVEASGDEEVDLRMIKAHDTADKLDAGEKVTGLTRLGELIGADVTKKAAKWLMLSDDRIVLNPGDPLRSARCFVEVHGMSDQTRTLHHWNDGFYSWDGVHYPELEDGTVRADLYGFLERAKVPAGEKGFRPFRPDKAKIGNVVDALKAVCHVQRAKLDPPDWLDDRQDRPRAFDLLACRNGLLHLPTRQLLPPDPRFFTLNALDYGYDPSASAASRWQEFLRELWGDDEESVSALQEMFGYALTPDTSHQKIFMMVGPKRSGKGTIGRVLTAVVGKANVAGPTLDSLGKNFGLQPLLHKQLAIISDARLSGKSATSVIVERLLSVSGEDAFTIDRKFREAWTGKLNVRFLLLTNELPSMMDASGALASRFIILKLAESFLGREDRNLTTKLTHELPAILNWAIEGWYRLQERGHFEQPRASEDAVRALEDLASPISAFIRDRCTLHPDAEVRCDVLYEQWKQWCEDQGHRVTNVATFGRDLMAAAPGIRKTRARQGITREWHYAGIKLGQAPLEQDDDLPF